MTGAVTPEHVRGGGDVGSDELPGKGVDTRLPDGAPSAGDTSRVRRGSDLADELRDWAWNVPIAPTKQVGADRARLVLLRLIDYADTDCCAWPAAGTIAEGVRGLTRWDVRNAFATLAGCGVIQPEGYGARGRQRTRRWRICAPNLSTVAGMPATHPPITPSTVAGWPATHGGGHGGGPARHEEKGREEKGVARASAHEPGPPPPYCPKHPQGTSEPCAACADARRNHQQAIAEAETRKTAEHAEQAQWREWADRQPNCPHGIAGGDLIRPSTGTKTCALCRRASETPKAAQIASGRSHSISQGNDPGAATPVRQRVNGGRVVPPGVRPAEPVTAGGGHR